MSIEELKTTIATLTPSQQTEVSAFLFHLRHATDPEYQSRVEERLADKTPKNWLTLEEFEQRLDQK